MRSKEERAEYNRQYREKHKAELDKYQREYSKKHSAKKVEEVRLWRLAHPGRRTYKFTESARNAQLRYKYGIEPEAFDAILAKQDGVCAICKKPSEERLHVDHDHKTNKVRGLLCGGCNRALGLMKDSPETLRAAAEYLDSTSVGE